MIKSVFLSMAVIVLPLGSNGLAQVAPTSPNILKPVGRMAWTMTVKPQKTTPATISDVSTPAAEKENNQPQEAVALNCIFSNGLTKVVVTFNKGPEREYWKVGNGVLCRMFGGPEIELLPGDLPRYPYAARGFYGVENVRPEHFQGEVEWEKANCRYYRGKREATLLENPPAFGEALKEQVEYEAWFDVKTGLPKAYKAAGKTFLFEFSPEAPQALVLPAEWRAAVEKHELDLRRAGLAR